ncbi:MAG: chemotaxis response regulator protein-glutamate methylesterase [Proteobacteria bacterium]|nr:chemotaxis response regulator protein-glutamate methylesterase [Pseudomonadota bacterium]NOG58958.1 chemotaxis response regulator protein-glutamate methylesterase [Pseudomonadota bacterium]
MVKVLIVDDSSFFRRRIAEFLSSDSRIEVIGQAVDGLDAVEKVNQLNPDVITMDIEMPKLDGISAVKKIRETKSTPILMFSSLTHDGAKATFEALDAGASDFLPKKFEDIATEKSEAIKTLCDRVVTLSNKGTKIVEAKLKIPEAIRKLSTSTSSKGYQLAVIGASTGGPAAIEKVLKTLPADFSLPILLTQHMPGSFTGAFAERLNKICAISVKEAEDGDELRPGTAYVAPGGRQMRLKKNGRHNIISIIDDPAVTIYKPCVDVTFNSIAEEYSGRVLAIVMTGMGSDGCKGARLLREKGATVWVQDEASCVVYGMPMAVVKENLADKVMSVDEIGMSLARH